MAALGERCCTMLLFFGLWLHKFTPPVILLQVIECHLLIVFPFPNSIPFRELGNEAGEAVSGQVLMFGECLFKLMFSFVLRSPIRLVLLSAWKRGMVISHMSNADRQIKGYNCVWVPHNSRTKVPGSLPRVSS